MGLVANNQQVLIVTRIRTSWHELGIGTRMWRSQFSLVSCGGSQRREECHPLLTLIFFWKKEALLILDNYIKMIQLYKIHSGLCITKMHTAYEKETKKKNVMT